MSVATTISNILTSEEAAAQLGLDRTLICRYCRLGRIAAEKVGRDWIIRKEALKAFARKPRKRGNPTFQKS